VKRGHGSKMSAKMRAAIMAVLTARSLAVAAAQVGIAERTLTGWLQDADFQRELRATQRRLLERGLGQLQALIGDAVATLRDCLSADRPADRIRAAGTVLDAAMRGVQLLDLVEQVKALEEWRATVEQTTGWQRHGQPH
jgi:hypothetical protein